MPVLIAGTMLLEAAIHHAFFGAHSFAEALFARSIHEWWMRFLFTGPVIVSAYLWSRNIRERNRRLDELHAMQERLRDLNARLTSGEILQRGELAERLHENVSQTIAAAAMYLGGVDRSKLDDAERAAVQSATSAITQATAELRSISLDLRPGSPDGRGLKPAIEAFARRTMRSTGVSVDVCYDDSARAVADDAAAVAFQAICEVIETAADDSAASVVRVTSVPAAVPFQISVDCDTEPGDVAFASQEWLRSIGGDIIRTTNGSDTRFVILVPSLAE